MELQEVKPIVKGRWTKGQSGNPKGRKPAFQDYKLRVESLVTRYTFEQIIAIGKDSTKIGKLPGIDGLIMQRLYEATQLGGRNSLNDLLDRVLGKPAQYIEQKNTNTVTVVMQNAVKELRDLSANDLLAMKQIIDRPLIDVTPDAEPQAD